MNLTNQLLAELRPENAMHVEKASSAEKVSNMMNDGANDDASTEVVQIVEEDHEEVEESQVLNHSDCNTFLCTKYKSFLQTAKKELAGDRREYDSGSKDGQVRGINFFRKLRRYTELRTDRMSRMLRYIRPSRRSDFKGLLTYVLQVD